MASPDALPPHDLGGDLGCGAFAHGLISGQVQRVVDLQADVLKDRDPEHLHQMRVGFRRLRATLLQFDPALVLPQGVGRARLAKVGRRLGMARDLDVLRLRLVDDLMPQLPEKELAALAKLFKHLRRERRHAFAGLTSTLRGRRYLELLAKLQAWLKRPQFTVLGEQPVLAWLPEWKAPALACLLVHPGWGARDPQADQASLHDLRKRIKAARYGLTNLTALEPTSLEPWIADLKRQQDLLGELADLSVLQGVLVDQLNASLDKQLPTLASLVLERRSQLWNAWSLESRAMLLPQRRQAFHRMLWGVQPPPAQTGPAAGLGLPESELHRALTLP